MTACPRWIRTSFRTSSETKPWTLALDTFFGLHLQSGCLLTSNFGPNVTIYSFLNENYWWAPSKKQKSYKTTIAIKNSAKTIKICRNWVHWFQERDSISRKANHKWFRSLVKWSSVPSCFFHGQSAGWTADHVQENWMYMLYIGQCLYRKRLSKTNSFFFRKTKIKKWNEPSSMEFTLLTNTLLMFITSIY